VIYNFLYNCGGLNGMVSIITKQRSGKTLYYLKYSSRINPKEEYIGTEIPKDIQKKKITFEENCYREEKNPQLEKIKKNYKNYQKITHKKILENEIHALKIMHTYSTQKIEGSTMTLGQTRNLLENHLSPKDTSVKDIIEAQELARLFDKMLMLKEDITLKLILNWHRDLFAKTDPNDAGEFRKVDVAPAMGKTEYALWYDVQDDLLKLLKWYSKQTMNPVELACRFHRKFELIHPFIDGNGRIGRLLLMFILHKNSYPMSNIVPKEKFLYIRKLEESYMKNDEMIFVKWFISKYLKNNKKFE
jgi:Fic family protein